MSRAPLIASAVTFLRDPSTSSSPLAQRIAFLESKGLSPPEIEQALSAVSSNGGGNYSGGNGYGGGGYGGMRGKEFERDWRDWFIMGVVGGAVGWVGVRLVQKFLLPHLQPPTETALLASQQALEAKYDEAAALLTTLQTSTDGLVASVESQRSAVEVELVEVRKAVEEMKEGERARDEWARRVREQVDEVVKSLPAMLEKQSQSSSQSLTDLQTELKSLKSLLIARRPNSVPTPSSPTPSVSVPVPYLTATAPEGTLPPPTRTSSFTARPPGIPSWQLKGAAPVVAPAPVVVPAPAVEAVAAASEDTSASGVLVQKEDAGPVVVDASV